MSNYKYYFTNPTKDEYSIEKITERTIQDIDSDLSQNFPFNNWDNTETNQEQFKQINPIFNTKLYSLFKANNSKKGTYYDLEYIAKINGIPISFIPYKDKQKIDNLYCFGYTTIFENTDIKTYDIERFISEDGCDKDYGEYKDCGTYLYSYILIDDSLPVVDFTQLKDNLYTAFEERLYACTWIKDIFVPLHGLEKYDYKLDEVLLHQNYNITTTDLANHQITEDNYNKLKIYEGNDYKIGTYTYFDPSKIEWKRSIGEDYFEIYTTDNFIKLKENTPYLILEYKRIDEFINNVNIYPKSEYNYNLSEIIEPYKIKQQNTDTLINLAIENNEAKAIENNELPILAQNYYEDNLICSLHRKIPLKLTENDNTRHLKIIENGVYDELRGYYLLDNPKIQINGGYLDYKSYCDDNQPYYLRTLLWDNFEFTEKSGYKYIDGSELILENTNIKIGEDAVLDIDLHSKIAKSENEIYSNIAYENSNIKLLENDNQIIRDYEETQSNFIINRKPEIEEYNYEVSENRGLILGYKLNEINDNIAYEGSNLKLLENDNQVIKPYYDEDFSYEGSKKAVLVAYENNPIKIFNSIYDSIYDVVAYPVLCETYEGIKYKFNENGIFETKPLPKSKWDFSENLIKLTTDNEVIYENSDNKLIEYNNEIISNLLTNNIKDYYQILTFNENIKLTENTELQIIQSSENKISINKRNKNIDEYEYDNLEKEIYSINYENSEYVYTDLTENNKQKILENANNYIVDNQYKDNFNYLYALNRIEYLVEDNETKILDNGLFRNRISYPFNLSDRNKYRVEFTDSSLNVLYLGKAFNENWNTIYSNITIGGLLLENNDTKIIDYQNETNTFNISKKEQDVVFDLIYENSNTKLLENENKRIFYNNIREDNYILVRKDNRLGDVYYYENNELKVIPQNTYDWVKLRVYDDRTEIVPYIPIKEEWLENFDKELSESDNFIINKRIIDNYEFENDDHFVVGFSHNFGFDKFSILTNENVKLVENTDYKIDEKINDIFEYHYKTTKYPYLIENTNIKTYEGIPINSALNTEVIIDGEIYLRNILWDRFNDDYTNQFIVNNLLLEDTESKALEIQSNDKLLNEVKVSFIDRTLLSTLEDIKLKENNDIAIENELSDVFKEGNQSVEDYNFELNNNEKYQFINNSKDETFFILYENNETKVFEGNNIKVSQYLELLNNYILTKTFNMKVGFIDGTLLSNGLFNKTIGLAQLKLLEDTEIQQVTIEIT